MNKRDQNDKRCGSNRLLQSGIRSQQVLHSNNYLKKTLLTYHCTVIFLNIVKYFKEPSANQCVYLNFSA